MTTKFGKYQIRQQLSHSAFARVFVASNGTAPDSVVSATEYVVKLFETPEIGQSDHGKDPAVLFAQQARIQQKVVAAGAVYWAAVHEAGVIDGQPYFVTDFYPRSTHKLIVGRVMLSSMALHELIGGVVNGLEELKRLCGRAHGNLKATNVLIRGIDRVGGVRIALTDPSSEPCTGEAAAAEDRLALGTLLYQLVMNRLPHRASWPIESSKEWNRLGRHGERWRSLCNDLLDPNGANRPDYPAVSGRLAAMVPLNIPWVKILAPTAALVVLAIVIHFAQVSATRAALASYQNWVGSLLKNQALLRRLDDAMPNPPLVLPAERESILAFGDADHHPWLSVSDLLAARRTLSRERKIHDRLTAAYRNTQEQEKKLSDGYQKRDWTQPAQFLCQRASVPAPSDSKLAGVLADRLAGDSRFVPPAGNQWKRLEDALNTVENFGNRDLTGFARTLRTSAMSAIQLTEDGWKPAPNKSETELDELFKWAEQITEKTKDKKDIWPRDFDRIGMARTENINFAQPQIKDVETWLAKVDDYVFANPSELQPRVSIIDSYRKQLDEIDSDRAAAPSEWMQQPDKSKPAFDLQETALRAEIDELANRRFHRKELSSNPFEAAKNRWGQNIQELRGYHTNALAAFVSGFRAYKYKSPSVANARERLLPPANERIENWSADRREKTLGQLKALEPILRAWDNAFAIPNDLVGDLHVAAEQQRDKLIAAGLGDLKLESLANAPNVLPDSEKEFFLWCQQAQEIAKYLPLFKNGVLSTDDLKSLQDRWLGPQTAKFIEEEAGPTGPLNKAIGKYLDRLRRLDKLHNSADWDELRAAATASAASIDGAEIALTAWQRLKDPQIKRPAAWLANLDSLRAETAFRSAILNAVHSAEIAKTQIAKEDDDDVQKAARKYWTMVDNPLPKVNASDRDAKLTAAMALYEAQFDGAEKIDAPSSFNLALYRARSSNDKPSVEAARGALLKAYSGLTAPDQFAVRDLVSLAQRGAADASGYLWPNEMAKRKKALTDEENRLAEAKKAAETQQAELNAKIEKFVNEGNPKAALALLDDAKPSDRDRSRQIQDLIKGATHKRDEGEKAIVAGDLTSALQNLKEAKMGGDAVAIRELPIVTLWENDSKNSPKDIGGLMRLLAESNEKANDMTHARDWYTKAAERKDPIAMNWLIQNAPAVPKSESPKSNPPTSKGPPLFKP